LSHRRRSQALRVLDDARGIGIEQIAALQHVEDPGGVPIEPLLRSIALHGDTQRCDATVHAVQVHGINEICPVERLVRVVDQQRGLAGGIGIAAGECVVVRGEGLKRLEAGLCQGLASCHPRALVVHLASPHHRATHVHELRQIAFPERSPGLHDGGDALV
jgi:hypothetical protein